MCWNSAWEIRSMLRPSRGESKSKPALDFRPRPGGRAASAVSRAPAGKIGNRDFHRVDHAGGRVKHSGGAYDDGDRPRERHRGVTLDGSEIQAAAPDF